MKVCVSQISVLLGLGLIASAGASRADSSVPTTGKLGRLVGSQNYDDYQRPGPWSISVGLYCADEGRGYKTDTGFSLDLARSFFRADNASETQLGLRYSRYSSQNTGYVYGGGGDRPGNSGRALVAPGTKADIDVFNPHATVLFPVDRGHKFYVGPELGVVYARGGGSETNGVNFGLGGGVHFNRVFVNGWYYFATGKIPNAAIVSLGVRF